MQKQKAKGSLCQESCKTILIIAKGMIKNCQLHYTQYYVYAKWEKLASTSWLSFSFTAIKRSLQIAAVTRLSLTHTTQHLHTH